METPGSAHTARPCATNRLARFMEVNRQSETGFSIRMFLRIVLVCARVGLRVCPQGERLKGREILRGLRFAPVDRTDPLLINTRRPLKTESAKCSFSWLIMAPRG